MNRPWRIAERTRIEIGPDGVFVDGADVTRAIRTPEIDRRRGVARLRASVPSWSAGSARWAPAAGS
jgi:hypothetical protein